MCPLIAHILLLGIERRYGAFELSLGEWTFWASFYPFRPSFCFICAANLYHRIREMAGKCIEVLGAQRQQSEKRNMHIQYPKKISTVGEVTLLSKLDMTIYDNKMAGDWP
jgi:hypothetical protein